MNPYSKITTVWERDPATKYKTLIPGQWALPVFAYLQNAMWSCYEKIDGTNIRVTYWPLIGDYWMEQPFVTETAAILGLQRAPIMLIADLSRAIDDVRSGLRKSHWGDFLPEGFILRPTVDLYTRQGHRIISKIKHKDFYG